VSPQRFDRSARNLAWWRILALRLGRAVKISNFSKFKMADGRHFEISENGHIPATVHAINTQFGTLMHNLLALWTGLAVKIFHFLKFKMADAVILKHRKTAMTLQRFDWSALNLVWWRILALRTGLAVKISNFWKLQDGERPSLETESC